jgi:glycosyltransferase involved in cell wall biosynthesis
MKVLVNYLDFNHNEERKKLNTYGGVGYYRLIKPAKFIKAQSKHEIEVMGKEATHFGDALTNWDKVFQKYDALWIASVYGESNMSAIFYWAQHHKKKVIMDVDDNYLDLPQSNLMYDKFAKGKKERALFSASISLADVITVSTEPLRDRLKEHFKTVYGLDKKFVIIPNMSDPEDWNFTPAEKHKDKIVIGYPGSNSHQDDLVMVMPVLAKLMKKHKNLHLELMGSVPKDLVKQYFGKAGFDDDSLMRIDLVPSTATFIEYPPALASQKWDIGIAPLVDTAFTRSKSHIKWM